jgi:uracil phosphoribosyltransferase
MFEGVLSVFPNAEGGFLIYQRDHETLLPKLHSTLLPALKNKVVILVDPMIATAGTIKDSLRIILSRNPRQVFVMGAIAANLGIQRIQQTYPQVKVVVGVVDPTLNSKGYIVPGLGDAGDRSYGVKSEN